MGLGQHECTLNCKTDVTKKSRKPNIKPSLFTLGFLKLQKNYMTYQKMVFIYFLYFLYFLY